MYKRQTQGKGTIQSSPQRLSDGSAVVVTVAKLVCGDGSCFDGTGLTCLLYTSPKRHVSKTYTVVIDTPLTEEMRKGFAEGVTLADGTAPVSYTHLRGAVERSETERLDEG